MPVSTLSRLAGAGRRAAPSLGDLGLRRVEFDEFGSPSRSPSNDADLADSGERSDDHAVNRTARQTAGIDDALHMMASGWRGQSIRLRSTPIDDGG
ncbi:hypothetical protein ABEG18_06510 [Alsobacter sp. KACC 23698]|uniref:Uncharacterized protein n=1 Tax=Alsobacter sp. KACC 23698 TaxID=3149229 RepID=A0AAU7JJU4_9HYPH